MSPAKNQHVATLIAAAAVTLALVALVALVAVRVDRARAEELRAERGWRTTPAEAAATRSSQLDRLSRYGWIDRSKNVTSIPIERAMSLVVEESARARAGAPR